MLQKILNNPKYKFINYILLFSFLFLAVRLPYLNRDTINPDGVNWHYRTQQFWNGIKYQQFEKTYQHYHPGITLMWISGFAMETYSYVRNLDAPSVANFQVYDHVAKLSMVFAQLIVSVFLFFLLNKFFGVHGAFVLTLLINLEPFFVGNSRLYHMDALFSLLVFTGIISSYLSLIRKSWQYAAISGVLFGLSILTKSIGMLVPAFFVLWNFGVLVTRPNDKFRIRLLALSMTVMLATIFLLFPALWVKPIHYLTEILTESERVGIRGGHDQIFFGERVSDPGWAFYPVALALKISPFTLIGILIFVLYSHRIKSWGKEYEFSTLVKYTFVFMCLYSAVMFLATKKLDRYLLPLFPILSLYAYLGYLSLERLRSSQYLKWILGFLFIVLPLVHFYPYYFTYTSPLFGTPLEANNVVGQKPFGIGVYALKDRVLSKYPQNPKIGVYDTKPLKSIYSNSRVVDVRETGAGDYDLLILAINEEYPQRLRDDPLADTFELVDAYYINGLEYWRIYAKK